MTRPAASRFFWVLSLAAVQLAVWPALAPAADGDDTGPVKVEVHILTELNIAGLTSDQTLFAAGSIHHSGGRATVQNENGAML